MVQKPLRYQNSEAAKMAIRLHVFESTKVAGPGSSRKKITDVLWTKKEVINTLSLSSEEVKIFEKLLESLKKQNHLMQISNCIGGEDGYVTRTAETLRIVGHTYEYWTKGRPGVDALRWEVVPKVIPRRDIEPEDFIQRLITDISNKTRVDEGETSLGDSIRSVIEGIVTHFIEEEGIRDPKFSDFQYRATLQGLIDSLGLEGKGTVLVAGVGSGKTLSFMLPPLILAKRDIIDGNRDYRAHLFLYPRKALALDQFSKSLKPYSKAAGIPLKYVHSEMGKHYRSLPSKSVYKGIRGVHTSHTKPRLVISSMETLKNRISHPIIVNNFLSRVQTITMDEVHLQSGVTGAQTAMLMRRIGNLCGNDTTWIGASATIAKPEEHLGRLMGIDSERIKLIEPKNEELEVDGVVHHVFMRPSGLISQAGVLTNATSLVVHHRRDDLSKRPGPKQSKMAPKVITFADNLEILGSWNDDFKENERTDVYQAGIGQVRYHPDNEDMNSWDPLMRELPYARRFQNTLERRIEAHGGIIPEAHGGGTALAPVFEEWRGKEVCKKCKNGERFELGFANKETMYELSKLVHRAPHKVDDPLLPFMIKNDEIFMREGIVGTQEMCPYLQAAACTSFSSHPVEEVRRIGELSSGIVKYDFASRATSNIQSSKSEDYSEYASDLSEAVFRAPNENLYAVNGARGEDFVDVVMASPSLEVGVDLPNLTESVMTRAVRNLASYRQKAGRVGRESMSEALNLTLATDSAHDLHYYRQPRKLIDRGRLEPVPLKEKNDAVARSTAYLSIWDILVKKGHIPEALMEGNSRSAHQMIEKSYEFIKNTSNRNYIHNYISKVLDDERFQIGTDWFDEAINQVKNELGVLMRPVSGYEFQPPLSEPKTVISGIRHIRGNGQHMNSANPVDRAEELVENFEYAKNAVKKRRRNLGFLREDNSDLLDEIDNILNQYSINLENLENLIDRIKSENREVYKISEPDKSSKIKRFIRAMDDLSDAVDELDSSEIDLLSFRTIEQYQKLCRAEEGSWKSYYFSATIRSLEIFKQLRENPWFVSPDALYIHPHMKMVKLIDSSKATRSENWAKISLREDQSLVPLSEALHSYLPGMWTRRLPQTTFKVLAKTTTALSGRTLRADIDLMEEGGLKYEVVNKSLPAPPGLNSKSTIKVISPLEIPIEPLKNKRTIRKSNIGPEVLDGDEGTTRGRDPSTVSNPRIPKSFSQRWLNIEVDEGVDIEPYIDLNQNERLIERYENNDREIDNQSIIHPLSDAAFSSIKWHKGAIVTEYVYGLSRTLKSGDDDGSEIFYENERGSYISFGQKINTEGVSFNLKEESINKVKRNGKKAILDGKTEWMPSMIRAFRSYLREINTIPLSNFTIDDIISMIIATWRKKEEPNLTLDRLKEISQFLIDERHILRNFAISRVDAKMKNPDDETMMSEEDQDVRENRINRIISETVRNLELYCSEENNTFEKYLDLWLHRSILMSFGVCLVSATQRVSGGNSNEIGYGLTDGSWHGNESTVVVYDRAECGNGNVSVARTFMHIPNIVRSARGSRGSFLPTNDFLSTLEEVLLPCAQQHCDLLGLEFFRTEGNESVLHRSMKDYMESGKEIYNVGNSVWKALKLEGPSDGWKLPILHYIRNELSEEINQEQDDVIRSTKICWNGCPECVERIDVVQGGFTGMDFLDKSVMDYWFRIMRESSNEYVDINPESLTSGESGLDLGTLHNLILENSLGRCRSLMLPWTIGVDLDRSKIEEGIKLIIRQSDILGLRQTGSNDGVALSMPSTSFKRLLWFNLLMTAYLDIRGAFEDDEENKKITLLYYHICDFSFEDIGLAPQLLQALREQAKIDNMGSLNKFSDILIWLAKRGFNIHLCVDKRVRNRRGNKAVRKFIDKLKRSQTEGRIKLTERNVIDGDGWQRSMHKKTTITPIAVLKGTANMTPSGTGLNEEDVDHIMFGRVQYESTVETTNDVISMSSEII
jgi:hypothetical protein